MISSVTHLTNIYEQSPLLLSLQWKSESICKVWTCTVFMLVQKCLNVMHYWPSRHFRGNWLMGGLKKGQKEKGKWMTKRKEKEKKVEKEFKKRIAQLYVKVDSERERKGPCLSSSGADWLLLILSAALSTLSVAEEGGREMWEGYMIQDSIPRILLRDILFVTQAQTPVHTTQNTW